MIAIVVGAAVSVGLTLYAGQRVGAPPLLLVLFAGWVVSPFVILGACRLVSKRWSPGTRAALYRVSLAVTVASVAIYGYAAAERPRPKTALFVIAPPASWLLIAIVVPAAAFRSRKA